ncbi:expressed unknown protein [Seminavis robusta]|uniref:Uncharacterized protein n=1 Tax=Seminavis robusta TaxID=568900 RepID=A0A9N8EDK7_9STRA|nr:expressed unknown protein [Seminavis robusta]|eukprot:Sro921_g220430.1 n/a (93) ;mRNA; r:36009-36424
MTNSSFSPSKNTRSITSRSPANMLLPHSPLTLQVPSNPAPASLLPKQPKRRQSVKKAMSMSDSVESTKARQQCLWGKNDGHAPMTINRRKED